MALETWVIGAIINLIGSILINLGTNIIKYHYHKIEKSRYTRPHATSSASATSDNPFSPSSRHPITPSSRSKTWWIGFCVFTIGNITNFVSMGFAAQSLLAGLGSVQFISNVVFSSCVLKQQVTNRILLATFAIVVGNMLIVVFASHESGKMSVDELWNLYSNTAYKVYMTILLCLVVVLYVFYKEYKKRIFREYPGIHGKVLAGHKLLPCAYAAISGIIGTQSVLLAKSSSELVRTSIAGVNQFVYPFTYLILTAWIGSMLFWLYRMNAALRKFDGVFIIPVLQVVWTLFSIIGGGIYFQEFNTFTPIQIALFTLGVLIVMFGVYLLAPQQTAPGQRIISGGEHSSDIGSRNSELYNLRASSSSYSASTSPAPFNMPTQIRLALAVRHASGHFHNIHSQPGSTSGSVNNSGHQAQVGSGLDLVHSDSNIAGYTTFVNDIRTSSIGSDIIQYSDSPTHAGTKITTINTTTISATPTPILSSPTSPQILSVGPAAIAHADAQAAATAAAGASSRSAIRVSPGIGHFAIEVGPSPSPTSPHERSYSDHGGNEARRIDIEDSYSISVPSSPRTSLDERRSRAMSMGFTMPTFDIEQESGTEEDDTTEP